MTVENISWSISAKECCRLRRGLNPRPPGLQSDGASNWATEAGWPCCKRSKCQRTTILLATLWTSCPRWFVQRFSPKAFSVLEKKIFKGFYHIWAWWPSWSTDRGNFSYLWFPHPKVAPYEIWAKLAQRPQRRSCLKFSTIFPLWGSYKCILGKPTWPCHKKVSMQILLATLVDLPSPMSLTKIQPQGILGSGEEDFYRFLPYMGMAAIYVNGPRPF